MSLSILHTHLTGAAKAAADSILRDKLHALNTNACRGTSKLLEAALASTAENGLSNAELGAAGPAGLLPPQYVDFKEQIRTEMFTIKQKMNELRASHGKATLTSFDDTNSSEVEIEVLTQDITRLFRKCEVRLQRFGDTASVSEADEKVSWVADTLQLLHHFAAKLRCTCRGTWYPGSRRYSDCLTCAHCHVHRVARR